MAETNAWKVDAEGYYIEMDQGEKKDYSLDWSDFLGADTIAAPVVWTLNANVVKISQGETSAAGQIRLHASGTKGVWACSAQMTSVGGLVDIVPFRVVIR